jgi:hypothetical protein
MKRTSSLSVVLILVVLVGLGWLARSLLRSDSPETTPSHGASVATKPVDALPAPAKLDRAPGPDGRSGDHRAGGEAAALVERRARRPRLDRRPRRQPERRADPRRRGRARARSRDGPQPGGAAQPDRADRPDRSGGQVPLAPVDPNDDYILVASHADFGECQLGPIEVQSGQEKEAPDIRLRVGVHIHGLVESNGRPVAGATVTLSNAMDKIRKFNPAKLKVSAKDLDLEPYEEKKLTDGNGNYEFTGVASTPSRSPPRRRGSRASARRRRATSSAAAARTTSSTSSSASPRRSPAAWSTRTRTASARPR